MPFNKSHIEDAALTWFRELGYSLAYGPHMAPGEPAAERDSLTGNNRRFHHQLRDGAEVETARIKP